MKRRATSKLPLLAGVLVLGTGAVVGFLALNEKKQETSRQRTDLEGWYRAMNGNWASADLQLDKGSSTVTLATVTLNGQIMRFRRCDGFAPPKAAQDKQYDATKVDFNVRSIGQAVKSGKGFSITAPVREGSKATGTYSFEIDEKVGYATLSWEEKEPGKPSKKGIARLTKTIVDAEEWGQFVKAQADLAVFLSGGLPDLEAPRSDAEMN